MESIIDIALRDYKVFWFAWAIVGLLLCHGLVGCNYRNPMVCLIAFVICGPIVWVTAFPLAVLLAFAYFGLRVVSKITDWLDYDE